MFWLEVPALVTTGDLLTFHQRHPVLLIFSWKQYLLIIFFFSVLKKYLLLFKAQRLKFHTVVNAIPRNRIYFSQTGC